MLWNDYCRNIQELLKGLAVTDGSGRELDRDEAFHQLKERTLMVRAEHKTIYCIGNGASASIASHFSADMAKNGKLHTEVFSDLALLTAISNDMGYEEVFAEPLRRRGVAGDLLTAISSSGNSPNVVRAAECAHQLGLEVITFTAMGPDNRLRHLGDLNFYFPAKTYGDAESVHGAVLHYWINMFLENL
ncbi:MAG: SIS domain-containing protein [Lentisphaeria bacterium]|nr:SIS domain-containing protein [Lentisphaeria bacterium]